MFSHDCPRPKMSTLHLLVVAVWIVWCIALQGRGVCPLLRQVALGAVETVYGTQELILSPVNCLAYRQSAARLGGLAVSAPLSAGGCTYNLSVVAGVLVPGLLHACLQHARQWPA